MYKSTIIGFPRMGSQRELKFLTESYFNKSISADTLRKEAAELRNKQWLLQKQHGIGFIPSNDFSFYDNMLDTAYLLNAVPSAYKALGFDELDTCFAMARGYQGEAGDVKALSMRKWFNTNYHYIVPILEKDTEIKLNSKRIFSQFVEARALGIDTTPVLIGPFTFLKLSECAGDKKDYINDLVRVYSEILTKFDSLGTKWIQIEEPYLVMDLTNDDIALFKTMYNKLLKEKSSVKVLLQTYFGDVRNAYKDIVSLGFDGVGLDFIEGRETGSLISKYGFPQNTLLFAGIVNGKNIWRNNYEKNINSA